MQLDLVTLDGIKARNDVYEVLLPTSIGMIAVFPGHMPLVTLIDNGIISIRYKKSDGDDQMDHFATYGGIAEVSGARIKVLVDEADTADDIIAEEAKAAMERAEGLRANAKNQVDLDKAKAEIDRHAVRLKVAGLRRRHRG